MATATALIYVSGAFAAQPIAPPSAEPAYTARATRIETTEAPTIDGDLSDPIWAKATVIDDFRQVEPNAGQPATERTVVRMLYDADNIYFGVYSYDKEPEKIVVRSMTRDGPVFAEDMVRISLDPNLTRRDGYSFEIGPAGGREDALVQNNRNDLTRWNTIFLVRSRIVADGWIAELSIPFRDFSFDRSRTEWGFDFQRTIRRKEELVRWTSHNPSIIHNDISQEGTLTNITDLRETIGLDVKVYGRMSFDYDWRGPNPRSSLSGTAGANAYYKLAQGLTLTGTLNPDFSDAPLDERLVNTTRFSLFIPESRDFFLQDAPSFEFGGLSFINAPNAQPFFSRNLGLINGTPVSIFAGGKLSGDYDGIGIGATSVRTNATPTTPAQNLSVLRMTTPVLSQSRLGFIATNGDPTGATENSLAGADFQYRASNVFGGILQADTYYERSFSDVLGDDDAFGTAINYPNEPWGGQFIYRQVGSNFSPSLGFVNRPGIRDYEATLSQRTRFRGSFLRWLEFGANGVGITGLDNRLQSSQVRLYGTIRTQQADDFFLNLYDYQENVPAAFSLPKGVRVPVGNYHWTNIVPRVATTRGRWYSVAWQVECCSFYNGSYFKSDLSVILRPNQYFEITPRHVATFIDLPTGQVAIHILSASGGINITPDMQILIQTQFDNQSRSLGTSMRFRWEYQPGNELFVSYGQSALLPVGTTFQAQTADLSIRLGNTFRF